MKFRDKNCVPFCYMIRSGTKNIQYILWNNIEYGQSLRKLKTWVKGENSDCTCDILSPSNMEDGL